MKVLHFTIALLIISCQYKANPGDIKQANNSSINYDSLMHSGNIKLLNEPDLSHNKFNIYRLTIHRPFGDTSILYRIEHTGMHIVMTIKYFESVIDAIDHETGEPIKAPGKLIKAFSKELTFEDWKTLSDKVKLSYFWSLETSVNEDYKVLDGSHWILEGSRIPDKNPFNYKTYHCAYLQTPKSGSCIHDVGEYIKQLGGVGPN